ncbi:MAG: HEAT repeat domain-containing protein [Planctomycetes bacterium]|nr:HEAT repeat domain-containing protein [Planctomycetota bacterium]
MNFEIVLPSWVTPSFLFSGRLSPPRASTLLAFSLALPWLLIAYADPPSHPAAELLARVKLRAVDVTAGAGERSDPEVDAAWRRTLAAGRAATVDLLAGLVDPSPLARRAAARALPLPFDDAAVEGLARALAADADDGVRALAARGLGRLRHPEGLEPLATALRGDASPRVRAAAATALGDAGGVRAPELLLPGLVDAAPSVRLAAVQALGLLRAPASLPALEARPAKEDSKEVGAALVANLRRFGTQAGGAALSKVVTLGSIALREAAARALEDLRAAGPDPEAAAEEEDREGAFLLRGERLASLLEEEIASEGASLLGRRWLYRRSCGPAELPLLLRLRERLAARPPEKAALELGALDETLRGVLARRLDAPPAAPPFPDAASPMPGATPEDEAVVREVLPRLRAAPTSPPAALSDAVRSDLVRLRSVARRGSDLPAFVAAYDECLQRFEGAEFEELLQAGLDLSSHFGEAGAHALVDPSGRVAVGFALRLLPDLEAFALAHPRNLLGLHFRARSLHLLGRAGRAAPAVVLAALEGVLACEREVPMSDRLRSFALGRLGEWYGRAGRYAEAEARLRSALALRPWWAEAWYNLASVRALAGRAPEAVEALGRCLEAERVQEATRFALDAQGDPTLDALRARADFQAVLRRAGGR